MPRLYLTREHDGRYMLTALQPVRAEIRGMGVEGVYVRPGDPIGLRGLCPAGTKAIFGVELELLESVKIEVTGKVI